MLPKIVYPQAPFSFTRGEVKEIDKGDIKEKVVFKY